MKKYNPVDTEVLAKLKAIVGDKSVWTDRDKLEPYSHDEVTGRTGNGGADRRHRQTGKPKAGPGCPAGRRHRICMRSGCPFRRDSAVDRADG